MAEKQLFNVFRIPQPALLLTNTQPRCALDNAVVLFVNFPSGTPSHLIHAVHLVHAFRSAERLFIIVAHHTVFGLGLPHQTKIQMIHAMHCFF